ncbi:MAG TPA: short chain dehydrogenase, partial [Chitinophagaceae bacterium]
TAAVKNLLGGEALAQMSRKPEIIADAAYYIFSQPAENCSGNFFIDEDVLEKAGITDLSGYAVNASKQLYTDLFLDE